MPIPKAELHLHIEGTLEPELSFALAGTEQLRAVDRVHRRRVVAQGEAEPELAVPVIPSCRSTA